MATTDRVQSAPLVNFRPVITFRLPSSPIIALDPSIITARVLSMQNNEDDIEEDDQLPSTIQFANRLAQYAFNSPSPQVRCESPTYGVSKSPIQSPSARASTSGPSSGSKNTPKPRRKRSASQMEGTPTMSLLNVDAPSLVTLIPSEGSKKVKIYNDLKDISDNLDFGLDIMFCGINPGEQSSRIGHHYGNPTNHFWACLHESGLTTKKLSPHEDSTLPNSFRYGLTNLVSRPTVEQSELSRSEQVAGVSALLGKIRKYRPLIVCFVGLGIADIFQSAALAKSPRRQGMKKQSGPKVVAGVGLQPYKMIHGTEPVVDQTVPQPLDKGTSGTKVEPLETLFFAVPSTSGRVVRYQKTDKVKHFTELKDTLEKVKSGIIDTSGSRLIDDGLKNITPKA